MMKQEPPKYLFFDVKTTGIKLAYNNIVQLAAILTDGSGKELETMDYIIYPDKFLIIDAALHGITRQRVMKEGIKIRKALTEYLLLVEKSDYLVAHNLGFANSFLWKELVKEEMWNEDTEDLLTSRNRYCTMMTTKDFVALNWSEKHKSYKWPQLEDLHWKLFEKGFEGAHNALINVRATLRCFFELKNKHQFYGTGRGR